MISLHISSTPPQNYLVEEILLGCILINPLIFSKVIHLLKIESFFLESHQIIYINLLKIYHHNKLHPIELLYSLSDNYNLQQIGGLKKITELMKQSQIFIYANNTDIYLNKLIQIINNNYTKRLIIQYGHNIIQLSYIKKIDGSILYNKASHYLNITVDKMPKNYSYNLQELMKNTIYDMQINKYKHLKNTIKKDKIIKSGFIDLDRLTYGLPYGDLIVLAGRPSMGKTSLAINIAYNILKQSSCSICFFSLEMSSKQILNKFIAISSNVEYKDLLNSNIYNNKWKRIRDACKELLNSNIYIYDKTNISIDYIAYISKIWIKDNDNIGLIIIDYLQLIQTDNLTNLNRVQQLSYITRKLKMLALYLDIPILTLSQLNRSIETRINKKPILSDLKESGCIHNKTHININNSNVYSLYIKNLSMYLNKLTSSNKNYLTFDILRKSQIFKIYINHEYIFDVFYTNKSIKLTHNHKCLNFNQWSGIYKFLENTQLVIIGKEWQTKQQVIIKYSFVNYLKYKKFNTVYDLSMFSYTHFICNNIILHNSIEQDADIVLMLYQEDNDTNANKDIIDLVISKNRHGPTGSCKLVFSKENTSFKNLQKNNINYFNI